MSVSGSCSAPSDRKARGALQTPEAVCKTEVLGSEDANLARAEVFDLPFGNFANSARGAEPKAPAPVVFYMRNIIAEQAIPGREPVEYAVAKHREAPAERADPQSTLPILIERANLIAAETIGGGKRAKRRMGIGRIGNVPKSVGERSRPNASVL